MGHFDSYYYAGAVNSVADIPSELIGYLGHLLYVGGFDDTDTILEWSSSTEEAQNMYEKLLNDETYQTRTVRCEDDESYYGGIWRYGSFDEDLGAFDEYVSPMVDCWTDTTSTQAPDDAASFSCSLPLIILSMFVVVFC